MTKHQRRYYQRRAARLCVQCEAGLLDDDPHVQCIECRARNDKYRRLKRRLAADRRTAKRWYRENRAKKIAKHKETRLAKKLAGECSDCPLPIVDDSSRCRYHLELNRSYSRERWRKKYGRAKEAA